MKRLFSVFICCIILLSSCQALTDSKYSAKELRTYQKAITDTSPLNDRTGLKSIIVQEYERKIQIMIALKEPITEDDFVKYCKAYRDIALKALGNGTSELHSLDISLSKNNETILTFMTQDLKSGNIFDSRAKDAPAKTVTFDEPSTGATAS